jgi:hypothetical protein
MEWWRLVLDYLQVLIWPAVVVFGMILFKRQISSLLGRLTKASALGVSIETAQEIDQAAEVAAEAAVEANPVEHAPHAGNENVAPPKAEAARPEGTAEFYRSISRYLDSWRTDLASPDFTGEVLHHWRGVESAAQDLAGSLGMRRTTSVGRIVAEAAKRGLATPSTVDLANRLSSIRHRLVHQGPSAVELTVAGAESLMSSMDTLAELLRLAADAAGQDGPESARPAG